MIKRCNAYLLMEQYRIPGQYMIEDNLHCQ